MALSNKEFDEDPYSIRVLLLLSPMPLLFALGIMSVIGVSRNISLSVIASSIALAITLPKKHFSARWKWGIGSYFGFLGVIGLVLSFFFKQSMSTDRILEIGFLGLTTILASAVLVWNLVQQDNQKNLQDEKNKSEKIKYYTQQAGKVFYVLEKRKVIVFNKSEYPIHNVKVHIKLRNGGQEILFAGSIMPGKTRHQKGLNLKSEKVKKNFTLSFMDVAGNRWTVNQMGLLSHSQ